MSRLFVCLWLGFLALELAGAKTVYVARGMLIASFLFLLWDWRANRSRHGREILGLIRARLKPWHVGAYAALTVLALQSALILDFEALHAALWDVAMYAQTLYMHVARGVPEFFYAGVRSNFLAMHSTASMYLMGVLYRVLGSFRVAFFWQGFCLFAPGLVAMLWYRALMRRLGLRTEALGYGLAFLCWAVSTVPVSQELLLVVFYIGSIALLALAYLFYFEKRWVPWALCLVYITLDKEELGGIATMFGALVFTESLFESRGARTPLTALALSAVITVFGLGYYIHYSHLVTENRFAYMFGHLAPTPGTLIVFALTHPLRILGEIVRPQSLNYLWYFFATSLLWLSIPMTRRCSALKYMVPVLPNLFFNLVAVTGTMQLFKDHYALPIAVGVCATLVFGSLGSIFEKRQVPRGSLLDARSFTVFALAALLPMLWAHQSTFRTLREAYELWRSRAAERASVADLKKDKDVVVCCDERLCPLFADRPFMIEARFCRQGTPILDGAVGRRAVYLVYATATHDEPVAPGLPRVPYPSRWEAETGYLKRSAMLSVERAMR